MPRFYLQKLVRDKLAKTYEEMGQAATYRELSEAEHLEALKQKIIEEAQELDPTNRESVESEVIDILQAVTDLLSFHDISTKAIQEKRTVKHMEKGGFSKGVYVEYLELADDDEWVEYYRREPAKYPERLRVSDDELVIPEIKPGVYEHYKGHMYEVIGAALETETLEPYVIYKPLHESPVNYWVRPHDMFNDTVVIDGKEQQRFSYVGDLNGA